MESSSWQKTILVVLFAAIVLFGIWFGIQQWEKLRSTCEQIHMLQEHVDAVQDRQDFLVRTNDGTRCDWTTVRKELRDTVVQVFVHVAQFNWLEPYKSPTQGQVVGSGFFIDEQGDLITNAHVVNQSRAIFIQIPSQGKRRFEVDLVAISVERDLALLRLKPSEQMIVRQSLGKVPFLRFGDSDHVRGSEELMTLGFPLGQQSLKGTTGIVSGREHIGGHYMIQISAPINPGNSGGPSINRCGEVIGVNTSGFAAAAAQNVNYIIPVNEVKLFIKQVEQLSDDPQWPVKFVRKGAFGFIYGHATDELTRMLGNPLPGGMYITDVVPGGLMDQAGVKTGDMVYDINGHPIDSFAEISISWSEDKLSVGDYAAQLMFGDPVTFKVYRSGKEIKVAMNFVPTKLPPIRRMHPGYESIDYEIFGGMVVLPLSMNLLEIMLPAVPELAWFADPRHQMEPILVLTHVMPDSVVTRARVFSPGMLISEVNGKPAKTLADLREALKESLTTGLLTIKTPENILAAFPFGQLLEEEEKLSRNYYYTITPALQALRDIWQEQQKKQATPGDIPSVTPHIPPLKELHGTGETKA